MSTKIQNRKYYLHRMIKRFATIRVGNRQILVPENKIDSIDNLKPRQKKYLNEIRNKYGYTIQATIPISTPPATKQPTFLVNNL